MKELIFLKTETSELDGKSYNISTFIDVYNYKILRGTNLNHKHKLVPGCTYKCALDVKFNRKKNDFVFFVSDVLND